MASDLPEARPSVVGDVREIAREYVSSRDLLGQLTLRDIKLRYKQAVMGFGWALFMPVLIVLAGLVIRMAMASVSGRPLDRAGVGDMVVKALAWSFFAGAIQFATPSLVAAFTLVTKVYFPREVLPISAVLAQMVDSSIGSIVVMIGLLALGVTPTAAWLWVPLLAAILITITAAAALFLSCANLFFRDVKYIVQVLLTFGIFFTPVLFEPSMFPARARLVLWLNPLTPVLEGLRLAVVHGHNLLVTLTGPTGIVVWDPRWLGYSATVAVVAALFASVLFHRSEFKFAESV